MRAGAGAIIFLLLLGASGLSSAAEVVAPTKAEVETLYTAASQELKAGNYSATLEQLDALDARQPDVAAAKNLRGVALMRMGEYGLAEKALQNALELDPKFWEARFNLAELSFLQKKWPEARARFEALAKDSDEQAEGTTGDLIQFKILLTWLLQGKEAEANAILDRLDASTQSPAHYYAKAAFAFRTNDETGAKVNLRAAQKTFAQSANQLFAESFYELGWMAKPDGATPVALEVTSQAERLARAKRDLAQAQRAFRDGDFESALQLLDQVDEVTPNQAVTYNLRGEILLVQGKATDAETAFRNALIANPELSDARYNLARLPFRNRDFETSRREFESLLGAIGGGKAERQREQLIRYQIYLTLLLEGRDGVAQKALEEFKMMDDTPALYYAQAAWAFQHGNRNQASNWIANAGNLFSPELNRAFAAPLNDLGWLESSAGSTPTATPAVIAAANPIAAKESTAAAPEVTTASPSPPLVTAQEEAEAAVPTPSPSPSPLSTPAASPPEKRLARREKQSEEQETEQPAARRSEDDEPAARAKSRETSGEKPKRANPPRARAKRAQQTVVAIPSPPPPPPPPAPPEHENLGDKVRNFILYPFERRTKENPTATPPPAPSPATIPRRN